MALYQLGVFCSRSSILLFHFYNLYLLSFLQSLNFIILFAHAVLQFIPSVYVIFPFVLWEGFLGGLAYVNTFAKLSDNVSSDDREFYIGAISASDSAGVLVASCLAMGTETFLCRYQVAHGIDFCKRL